MAHLTLVLGGRASDIHGYPWIYNVWISMVNPWMGCCVTKYYIHGYPPISLKRYRFPFQAQPKPPFYRFSLRGQPRKRFRFRSPTRSGTGGVCCVTCGETEPTRLSKRDGASGAVSGARAPTLKVSMCEGRSETSQNGYDEVKPSCNRRETAVLPCVRRE